MADQIQVATKQNPVMGSANVAAPKPRKKPSKRAVQAAKATLLGIPNR
jgi:hypothetical protein